MNLSLSAVYFCTTNAQRWGKGLTIAEAKKNAGITTAKPKVQYYVMAAILNKPNVAELKNLLSCITANNFTGGPEYYRDNRTDADTAMINEKHVGWLTVEKNY